MPRAIVRFSLNGDYGSAKRNAMVQQLETWDFFHSGTGTWEADEIPENEFLVAVANMLLAMNETPGPGTLDHLWIYCDRPGE